MSTSNGDRHGIGRSTAIRLARDFSSIVLAARDRPNLEKTADAVKAAWFLTGNVKSPACPRSSSVGHRHHPARRRCK